MLFHIPEKTLHYSPLLFPIIPEELAQLEPSTQSCKALYHYSDVSTRTIHPVNHPLTKGKTAHEVAHMT